MEMFAAFGFAEKVMREAYWVNETTFWAPDPATPGAIARTGRVRDVEEGLSDMPHVILNQARVHDMYLDIMANAPVPLAPHYGRRLTELRVEDKAGTYPVTVTLAREDGGAETVRARYVVGSDGARSAVRKAIGLELSGDSANQVWVVMDVLAVTDLPDIRFKTLIQSEVDGSALIIPREGGYLFRLYIEQGTLEPHERVADRSFTIEQMIAKSGRIFRPYSLDVKEVVWCSVYQIGQRLTERFDNGDGDNPPSVFIAGTLVIRTAPRPARA